MDRKYDFDHVEWERTIAMCWETSNDERGKSQEKKKRLRDRKKKSQTKHQKFNSRVVSRTVFLNLHTGWRGYLWRTSIQFVKKPETFSKTMKNNKTKKKTKKQKMRIFFIFFRSFKEIFDF